MICWSLLTLYSWSLFDFMQIHFPVPPPKKHTGQWYSPHLNLIHRNVFAPRGKTHQAVHQHKRNYKTRIKSIQIVMAICSYGITEIWTQQDKFMNLKKKRKKDRSSSAYCMRTKWQFTLYTEQNRCESKVKFSASPSKEGTSINEWKQSSVLAVCA